MTILMNELLVIQHLDITYYIECNEVGKFHKGSVALDTINNMLLVINIITHPDYQIRGE